MSVQSPKASFDPALADLLGQLDETADGLCFPPAAVEALRSNLQARAHLSQATFADVLACWHRLYEANIQPAADQLKEVVRAIADLHTQRRGDAHARHAAKNVASAQPSPKGAPKLPSAKAPSIGIRKG